MSIARSLSMLMVEFFYLANLAFYFTHFIDQVVALQRDLDEEFLSSSTHVRNHHH